MIRTFEECYDEIAIIVEKHRCKWTFKASVMRDFDDVKSEIITHIWKKWEQYDQIRSLGGWVATIVNNQFINILRNTYLSTSSPCQRCPCRREEGMCSVFGMQGPDCALYKKWLKTKKSAHDIRLPVAMENHIDEASSRPDHQTDLEPAIEGMHAKMQEVLTESEWEIYQRLFIDHKTYNVIAKELELKSNEKGRKPGHKRIRQVELICIKKSQEILAQFGIEGLR